LRPSGVFALLAAASLLAASFACKAQDRLISGPGSTLTENKCRICHELQHIRRSPLSRGEWADNLRNMKERGTPMSDAEMALILDYLSTYYNRDKPAPPPSADNLVSRDSIEQFLQESGCAGCHALEERVVGPSFKEIAARYAADPDAARRLQAKIRNGGQGAWGQVPMPPNPNLADADLDRLVGWVLQRKADNKAK
jgi:cytochrome c551/c552